eukprot:scaffold79637_cov54-Phaeocystis_antarctica.AAC.2
MRLSRLAHLRLPDDCHASSKRPEAASYCSTSHGSHESWPCVPRKRERAARGGAPAATRSPRSCHAAVSSGSRSAASKSSRGMKPAACQAEGQQGKGAQLERHGAHRHAARALAARGGSSGRSGRGAHGSGGSGRHLQILRLLHLAQLGLALLRLQCRRTEAGGGGRVEGGDVPRERSRHTRLLALHHAGWGALGTDARAHVRTRVERRMARGIAPVVARRCGGGGRCDRAAERVWAEGSDGPRGRDLAEARPGRLARLGGH